MDKEELINQLMPGEELITEWSRQNAMLPDVVARHTLEHALTTPITMEMECPICMGSGEVKLGRGERFCCDTCNGTGKASKTFTIKEAIAHLIGE